MKDEKCEYKVCIMILLGLLIIIIGTKAQTTITETNTSVPYVDGLMVVDLVYCDACGKCMTRSDSTTTLIGMEIEIQVQLSDSIETEKTNNFIDEQLGQYKGERNFKICYECWLKSLGVVPKNTILK